MEKKGNIKVQLDFNVTKKPHSLYNSLFNNPPEGVEYKKSEFRGINEKNYSSLGKIYWKIAKAFPFVEKFHQRTLDVLRKENGFDLIHLTFHLGNTKKPCVIDYENAYNFIDIRNRENKKDKKNAIKILDKKNIKCLMPINNEALKSFKLFFGEKVRKPQEVIYPTIFIEENLRKKVKKENIMIFIGSSNIATSKAFYIKGGSETVLAFERLSLKYPNYKFMIISKIPEELKIKTRKNLIIQNVLPQKELWEIMNKSLIFVQPNYHAPTMAYLEAMFFRMPIITYDCWANNEYVNEKNGILIKQKEIGHINRHNIPIYDENIINKIKENAIENSKEIEIEIEKLIKNPKLISKMGEEGFKEVTKGKFSLKKRNEKLLKIYKEALNNG